MASQAVKIFYNTLAQSLGKIFAAGVGLVTIALLSRYLAEKGFGEYSTVVAFLGFCVTIADLGLYLYVAREVSKPDTDHPKIIGNALGLRMTASVAVLFGGALIALLLPYDPTVKQTLFLGIAAFVFVSLNQVLIGIFQKHLVQYLVVISETVGRAVNLILIYLLVWKGMPMPYFVGALILANGINLLLTVKFAKRYENFGIAFDFVVWKDILRTSWPLVFSVVLNLLYFKTDTVILSLFHSEEAVGVYSLPYKLLEGLLAFPAMFAGLVMPLLSQYAVNNWEQFRQILQRSFDALILMAFLVLGVFEFFAGPIIDLLKGDRAYADSPQLLQILTLAAVTIFLGTLFGYAVFAVNAQKTMIKGYLLGAITGLALYLLLIPVFGYWGAAWGTVITEIIVASYAYRLVKKTSGQNISLNIFLRALPAALGMALFFYLFDFAWIAEIICGSLIYIILLLLFKAVPLDFVKQILLVRQAASDKP
ncbi:MAG: hypothetical protein A3C85_04515 [Candidatus Doudnabacteria bacterium RIFCSPHIGHO2_02_FULL_48_21]|uniref:Uncharacterized protein n=1 Tax=Candidatus Doudnabacteria bacterium RIFCSPLOWO2_02_FULL_48_13 TaxID=1817845 RepID=A0A1F5QDH7_9BACT|nr:MAG: hypothetical protein A3K05_00550 [Candidatus Doudnabacteria bacterium RIFCSPHIGHO2_01_48_18]OGE79677.1 MAG: hypothetical protein A2668_01100 [Candidatus Doudnabacteria bacterium RIFCSPHIGHO2_01_FULL_48_180]OGE91477.1 MAG: hypothetical protein A3F44_01300 [Candidatus Doudnabacteria bacterium RIFCSPHIGHO2_12_FULL_47_25]OGE93091.1 MAG: hypothetical protein A3C85_04515 [Candidatus Doudnabacteria bacterium RIFCSPHIGHO2_02_FULL_48_21]OGE98099.1 MAG: hypothetical protein A3A83_02480 [Candidatu